MPEPTSAQMPTDALDEKAPSLPARSTTTRPKRRPSKASASAAAAATAVRVAPRTAAPAQGLPTRSRETGAADDSRTTLLHPSVTGKEAASTAEKATAASAKAIAPAPKAVGAPAPKAARARAPKPRAGTAKRARPAVSGSAAAKATRAHAPKTAAPKTVSGSPVMAAASCPYCALLLQPPPTASKRCARCRQRIVVKRVDGRLAYLTEAAIAVFEAERHKDAASGRLARERERWLKLASSAGAPAGSVRRLGAAHVAEEAVEAARTLYMTTVERSFQAARRERRWEDAARTRRDQATTLHRLAGSPKPPPDDVIALHREGVAAQLRGLGEIGHEAELVGSSCCDACRAASGDTFSIVKELKVPRLPHEGCPKGLCGCTWDLAPLDREAVLRYLRRRPRHGSPAATRDAHTRT